jgi:hypothetical protein
MCVPHGTPTDDASVDLEPLFDSDPRVITAQVLLPVGERATRHDFSMASTEPTEDIDIYERHATETVGAGGSSPRSTTRRLG